MFLPVNKKEMLERGITQPDFVYICGDAYEKNLFYHTGLEIVFFF